MNILIINVLQVDFELRGGCAQISFLEDEEFMVLVDEDPDTDVKLAIVQQKRPFYVLLYYERVVLDLVPRVRRPLLRW